MKTKPTHPKTIRQSDCSIKLNDIINIHRWTQGECDAFNFGLELGKSYCLKEVIEIVKNMEWKSREGNKLSKLIGRWQENISRNDLLNKIAIMEGKK